MSCRLFLLLALLLSACPATNPNPTPNPPSDNVEEDEGISLYYWNNRALRAPITEGGNVELVFGFQGGYMIRPFFKIANDAGLQVNTPFTVTIRHNPTEHAPEKFHIHSNFQNVEFHSSTYKNDDGELVLGPIDDLISWDFLVEEELKLDIRLKADGMESSIIRNIKLIPEDASHDPCVGFLPDESQGCVYATVPVLFEIKNFIEGTGSCDAPVRIEGNAYLLDGEPNAGAINECVASASFMTAPWDQSYQTNEVYDQDCLASKNVVLNSELATGFEFIVQGTCAPGPNLHWNDTSLLDCLCN